MSRIGKLPVKIPIWVSVEISSDIIKVKWPRWALEMNRRPEIDVVQSWDEIVLSNTNISKFTNWLYWLTRTLISNMIKWVTTWYEKSLRILWVWYSAVVKWNELVLTMWFSHPVKLEIVDWIKVEMDPKEKWLMFLRWIDKQQLWDFAALVRSIKPPEPYKWKWIRYVWEYVAKKAWKSAKK